ncbi:PTS sugar transporter subunit IIA [Bacillus sp. SL00103]
MTVASQYMKKGIGLYKTRLSNKGKRSSPFSRKSHRYGISTSRAYTFCDGKRRGAPTSFGHYTAIPHPMTPLTEETFWAICTLEKPIIWGEKKSSICLLLCVEKENAKDLKGFVCWASLCTM